MVRIGVQVVAIFRFSLSDYSFPVVPCFRNLILINDPFVIDDDLRLVEHMFILRLCQHVPCSSPDRLTYQIWYKQKINQADYAENDEIDQQPVAVIGKNING